MARWVITKERFSGTVLVVLGITVIAIATTFRYSTHFASSYNPRVFPQIIGVLLVVSGVSLLAIKHRTPLRFTDYRTALPFMALLVLYTSVMSLIGWRISTFLMLAGGMILMGERRPRVVLAVSVGATAVAYLLFYELLFIDFPLGLFYW